MPETMSLSEKMRSNAMRGKWSEVLETYEKERSLRMDKITATEDTVLHMAVFSGKEKVVARMVDFLVQAEKSRAPNNVVVTVDGDGEESWNVNAILGAENDRKNTPLHLAAITGSVEICKKIGGTDPSLITRRNIVGETPLFLAALYGWKKAFLWLHYLYKRSQGDSSTDLAHCIRDNDDTILHCAIAEEHFGVAIEIVHLYKDLVRGMRRNKEGLSPLHLLAAKRSAFKSTGLHRIPTLAHPIYLLWKVEEKKQATTFEELQNEIQENILVKRPMVICSLLLVLPVLLLTFFLTIPMQILELVSSELVLWRWFHHIRKIKEKHIWSHQIMTELLQHASVEDMSETISRTAAEHLSISLKIEEDNESESGTITIETPLMIAAKNGVMEMVNKILELYPWRIKDVNADGKNILLQAVEYGQTGVFKFLSKQKRLSESVFREVDKEGNNALHLAARSGEINWFELVQDSMPCGLSMRYNRKMETPDDILRESSKERNMINRKWVAKTSEVCSVVSALVVSVAYATRTNLPGGYDDDNGYAILRNKPSEFKAFKDYSFVAFYLSLMSTICFIYMVPSPFQSDSFWRYGHFIFCCGVYLMSASIVCLWISFCAADFFMLHDQTHKSQKALPTYIFLSSMFILTVVNCLPVHLGPKLSAYLGGPTHSHLASPPIEYRRTKHK